MKAIIFDMGGVLVDLDLDACRNAFKHGLGFDEIDQALDPCHQKGVIGDMECGLITADQFRDYVIERSKPGVTADEVDAAFNTILSGIAPYKVDMLRSLARNYDLYMLSNNNPIASKRAAEMFQEAGFGMDDGFKKCYISYQMKMIKPSAEFYKAVMSDIGLPASEMVFIDDSQHNVDAANAAGLPAVYYRPGDDLVKLMESILR